MNAVDPATRTRLISSAPTTRKRPIATTACMSIRTTHTASRCASWSRAMQRLGIKSILDIGCGTECGLLHPEAHKYPTSWPSALSRRLTCEKAGYANGLTQTDRLVDHDAMSLAFPTGSFDLVCEFRSLAPHSQTLQGSSRNAARIPQGDLHLRQQQLRSGGSNSPLSSNQTVNAGRAPGADGQPSKDPRQGLLHQRRRWPLHISTPRIQRLQADPRKSLRIRSPCSIPRTPARTSVAWLNSRGTSRHQPRSKATPPPRTTFDE